MFNHGREKQKKKERNTKLVSEASCKGEGDYCLFACDYVHAGYQYRGPSV